MAEWGTSAWERLKLAIESLDLEAWLSQYAATKSGGVTELRLEECPKCGNSEFKLYVNTEHKHWICYVCSWGKHQSDLVVLLSAVSGRTLWDVRKELIETVVPAPSGDLQDKLLAKFNPTAAPSAKLLIEEVLLPGSDSKQSIVAQQVFAYARKRGLTDDEIEAYALRASVRLRAFSGPFLVFPLYYQSMPVNWQGRRTGNAEPRYVSGDDIARWLWPLKNPFYKTFQSTKQVTLVEGVFDAAGLWRIDIPALCTFGKKISDHQINLLQQLGIERISIAWDADAALTSPQALARGAKFLRGEVETAALRLKQSFQQVSVVDLTNPPPELGKKPDPGEALRNPQTQRWLQERIADAMDVRSPEFFQWRLL
jgi:hypothetical protein